MKRAWCAGGRWLARLSGLLPVVVAVQVGAQGVQPAEACTGGAPGLGWDSLKVSSADREERLPIATDGFVLLRGAFWSETAGSDISLPWVRVTNATGEELPGTLRVLRTEPQAEVSIVTLGWEADEPLEMGSVAKLSWSEVEESENAGGAGNEPAAVRTIELEVVAEPTPLPPPSATLGDWIEVRHGVGELVDCQPDTDCGESPIRVPLEEVRRPGVGISWTLPPISGMVAWEVWAEVSDPRDGELPPTPRRRQLLDRQAYGVKTVHDVVTFTDDATEHCAVMVVKDLRTGDELRSEPACDEPGVATVELADHELSSCAEPPTPESTAVWCLERKNDERCENGAGGQAGAATAPEDGMTGNGGASDVDAPGPRRDGSEGGCSYSSVRGGLGIGTAALGLLLVAFRRRRRVWSF